MSSADDALARHWEEALREAQAELAQATIEKRGHGYRYLAVTGDPLDLIPITQQTASHANGGDRFINDEDWFALTRSGSRPDAVRRVFEAATGGVLNQANVIVNLEDGYYTGSSLLDTFTILQATHGNIGQEQSYGFVMSTAGELPPSKCW